MLRVDPAHVRAAADSVLSIARAIRYVAIADESGVQTTVAPGREHASAAETDYYEERLVNPVLLELGRRRGNEGCGGFDFCVIRYGEFWQLLLPAAAGHVSVCMEPDADPFLVVAAIRAATHALGTAPGFDPPGDAAPELAERPFIEGVLPGSARILDAVYAAVPGVRYVAIRNGRSLVLSSRIADPAGSGDRSDRYEELIVNPTLLEIATARGSIDCGGVRHLTMAYPGFFALILPIAGGHVTVSLARDTAPARLAAVFEGALAGR